MENGTKKPKLTRLKIESFRNVEPCELRFGDGFNVLLGLNATGKTTLLELIAAALSGDFSKFKEDAFAVEYELSFSTGTIVVSMWKERVERPVLEAPALQGRDTETFGLSAKLQVRSISQPKAWTVCADTSSVWIEDVPHVRRPRHDGLSLLFEAFYLPMNGPMGKAYPEELQYLDDARRFDEALDMFRGVTSEKTWIEVRHDPSAGSGVHFRVAGVIPLELSDAVDRYVRRMPDGDQGLSIPQESLGFLRKLGALFGFKTARLEMRLESKAAGRTEKILKFSEFRFMFEDHDGSITRHDDLSYGQKRLLAFYYYLAASPLTVIADELVDGLHHLWIDAAITAIGDRQAFLASQNPLLLDHLEFDSAEQVASTFVTCRTERTGDEKRMIWSNLSTYDAERFFRAYQIDVKHVSEILLSKGLW